MSTDEYTRLRRQHASGARTLKAGGATLFGTVFVASLFVLLGSGALWADMYAIIAGIVGGMGGTALLVVGTIERRDATRQLRGLVPQARLLRDR